MTLKIDRIRAKRRTVIRLSGELHSENLGTLKCEIARNQPRIALDLQELDLVDLEGVRFLNECQSEGISVLHSSPFIREWMSEERKKETEDR